MPLVLEMFPNLIREGNLARARRFSSISVLTWTWRCSENIFCTANFDRLSGMMEAFRLSWYFSEVWPWEWAVNLRNDAFKTITRSRKTVPIQKVAVLSVKQDKTIIFHVHIVLHTLVVWWGTWFAQTALGSVTDLCGNIDVLWCSRSSLSKACLICCNSWEIYSEGDVLCHEMWEYFILESATKLLFIVSCVKSGKNNSQVNHSCVLLLCLRTQLNVLRSA